MNRPPVAWVLNLDAETELEVGKGYAPTRRLLASNDYAVVLAAVRRAVEEVLA